MLSLPSEHFAIGMRPCDNSSTKKYPGEKSRQRVCGVRAGRGLLTIFAPSLNVRRVQVHSRR